MKRHFYFLPGVFLILLGLVATNASAELIKAGDASEVAFDLTSGSNSSGGYASIFGTAPSRSLAGDSYNVAALIQTATQAFFLTSPGNVTQTFNNGSNKPQGSNLAYPAGQANIVVSELLTPLGGNQFLVQVQLTSVDANGNPNPWVPTGVTGPGGAIFTGWRMDLGTAAAAADRLLPAAGLVSIDTATMSVFNSAGGVLLTTAMSSNVSDLTGLAGLGVVGLGGGNIAGFNLASFQLAWTYTAVPEPSSGLSVLVFGFCALCRRKRS